MSVVVDANVLAALVIPLLYSEDASQKMTAWKQAGEEIFAPTLVEYEVATILRKSMVIKLLSPDDAAGALQRITDLNVQSVAPTAKSHQNALQWAERLGHTAAHDAQYLALAQQLRLEFWTGDRRLSNRAQQAGAIWARWIGEIEK